MRHAVPCAVPDAVRRRGAWYTSPRREMEAVLPMKDAMISTGAAATLLGKDRRTIRRMIDDKRLRSYRTPNGAHRLRLADVQALAGETDSQRSAAGGSSPALKNRKESVDELALQIQERRLKRDLTRLEEQEQIEEAEREAAAEEERQREAEERAQVRREQEERDRQRALHGWRTQMIDLFAQVPDEAPAALRVAFYEKARQSLAQFDCELPTDVVQALLLAIQEEIVGPWQCQREADARSAWIEKQTAEAWRDFSSVWRSERLGSADQLQQNADAPRESLRLEISRALQSLTPASSWTALHQARRCAVDRALATPRKEKELLAAEERIDSTAQAATRELGLYLRQLLNMAWLHCDPAYLEILTQDIEPRLLAFLQAHGRKQPQFSPAAARQLLEDFVLRDLGLL